MFSTAQVHNETYKEQDQQNKKKAKFNFIISTFAFNSIQCFTSTFDGKMVCF